MVLEVFFVLPSFIFIMGSSVVSLESSRTGLIKAVYSTETMGEVETQVMDNKKLCCRSVFYGGIDCGGNK